MKLTWMEPYRTKGSDPIFALVAFQHSFRSQSVVLEVDPEINRFPVADQAQFFGELWICGMTEGGGFKSLKFLVPQVLAPSRTE